MITAHNIVKVKETPTKIPAIMLNAIQTSSMIK